jgi:hypothetical protein
VADVEKKNVDNEMTWTIHPAAKRPVQAVGVFLFLVLTIVLVAFSFKDIFLTIIATLILFLSLTQFFLPTKYRVNDKTVEAKYPFSTRTETLDKFRSVIKDRNGLLLSTVKKPSLITEIRSFFLLVPREIRDEVQFFLEAQLINQTSQTSQTSQNQNQTKSEEVSADNKNNSKIEG